MMPLDLRIDLPQWRTLVFVQARCFFSPLEAINRHEMDMISVVGSVSALFTSFLLSE